jgi:hypothetical protein
VLGRKVEGERGQRVDDAEVAHVLAVDRLHADDADDDLRRHAELGLRLRQRAAVALPEAHAGADAQRLDEAAAVRAPVLGRAARGRQHQARHLAQEHGLADGLARPFGVQAAAPGHLVGPAHGVVAQQVGARLGGVGGFEAIFGLGPRPWSAGSYQ